MVISNTLWRKNTMKKVLASLLVVCTLLACMMISTSAANYTYHQDSVIEMDGFTKGNVNWIFFDPTDITGATKLQFDLYVGDADQFGFTTFEIGSHPGKTISDWQEKEINNSFGALNDGWNTVSIDLDSMANVAVTNPNDGTPGEFDYTKFCRIRFFNVTVEGKTTDVKFKNFTAVKADGTAIKVGAPAPTIVPTIEVLSAEWTGEHDWTITFKATGLDHPDFKGDAWVGVYPATHTSNSYSSADSMQTWRYLNEGRANPTDALNVDADNTMTVTYTFESNLGNADGCAPKEGVDYDIVLFFNDSGYEYVCRDGFRFNDTPAAPATDAPTDPVVEPTTFDAAASVAVAAVAALGVVLVASRKRH